MQEEIMQKKSYIVEDLEDVTHEKVKEFFNLITDQERIRGENMENNKNHFSYRVASSVIRLIKDGYVENVDAALDYMLVKTGITFNWQDDVQSTAWFDAVRQARNFNNGNRATLNCQRTFTLLAENKKTELYQAESSLPFTRADLLFEIYKNNGYYPHISLFERTNPIRVYKEGTGERRDIRYEIINGLSGIVARPENTTYKAMNVQGSYVYHQDSAHGWLEVPTRELRIMGLQDRITFYSYLRQGKAYLEEDVDMGTFLDIRRLLPKPFIFQSNNMDGMCFIRNYPQYRAEDIVPEKNKSARKHSGSKNAGWER
jgi:predicted small secreted protein